MNNKKEDEPTCTPKQASFSRTTTKLPKQVPWMVSNYTNFYS